MTEATRRYFWGNTLSQAVTSAARHFQIAPELVNYRKLDKRHGFVKQPRAVLIEVDPAAPRRESAAPASAAARPALPAPARPAAVAAPSSPSAPAAESATRPQPARTSRPEPAPRPQERSEPPSRPPSPRRGAAASEAYAPPDEESVLAASVAMGRLLRFAGLDLETTVERLPDRLELRLSGADEERLKSLGSSFLDDLSHLLPRLVRALSGRQILCRLDGAGLRSAREEELRELARRAAEQVLSTGEPVMLDPLPPGERRIVHVFLADDPRISSESLGMGVEKSMRIARATPAQPNPTEP